MITLDRQVAREMNQAFNPDGIAKNHVTVESLAVEWTVPNLVVFLGYEHEMGGIKATWRPLIRTDLHRDWLNLVNGSYKFLPGYIYTVYARYRVQYNGKRKYVGLHIRRDDDLTAQFGNLIKVMAVAL